MESFLITGASQSKIRSQNELNKLYSNMNISEIYDTAVLMEINFANKTINKKLNIKKSNFDHDVHGYATNFTVPHKEGNQLYLPSHSSIFIINLDDFKIENKISLKCFNDLHHVRKINNKLWAVATGIDSIVCYDLIEDSYQVFPTLENIKQDRSKSDIDYRNINTKPHKSHPNYFNYINGERWVTRAVQKDFFCLDTFEKVKLSDVVVHDGIISNNYLYFTAVKGQIVVVDFYKKKIVDKIDLKINGKEIPAWCRGLYIDENYFFVGFSMIRTTKISNNIKWLKAKFKNKIPNMKTTILKISRKKNEIVDKFEFVSSELTAIFSITKI